MILNAPQPEQVFLRKAIDALVRDPEPDGLTKFVAQGPLAVDCPGCLMNEVYPWRIVYQMAGRVVVVAIQIHPSRVKFM